MCIAAGLVLGTLYVGGYMMSQNEVTAGDLMSFMVATQTIQRYDSANNNNNNNNNFDGAFQPSEMNTPLKAEWT